ncbi:hypothetical protein BH09SUM1_BH09SUM1_05910 [soil metagenome]
MRMADVQIIKDTARRLRHAKAAKRETGLYPLEMMILYVTMRCNAKCSHCFCWEDLNVGIREMTLPEIEQLAESTPPLRMLLITGGEPMMRKDLAEVIRAFASRGKAQTIFVNTNGLKPDKVVELIEAIKPDFPHVGLDFQISLDGLEATHDEIRGVPGNFKKVIETLKRVTELRAKYPNLSTHALTVITEKNYTELVALNDYLRREVADTLLHGFELVRSVEETAWLIPKEAAEVGVGPKMMCLPPQSAFPAIARDLHLIQRRSSHRASAFHVHNLAQLRMVATEREQYKCVTAGQSVAVVYANGDVAHCEFTKPFGSLVDFDYNFPALWSSDAANERRGQIKSCFCTHGCFHGKAVEYSWRGIAEMARRAIL